MKYFKDLEKSTLFKKLKTLTTPWARFTSVAEGVCKTSVLLVSSVVLPRRCGWKMLKFHISLCARWVEFLRSGYFLNDAFFLCVGDLMCDIIALCIITQVECIQQSTNTTPPKQLYNFFKEWFALVIGEIRVQLQHFRDWEKMYFYMKRFFHQELRTLICPQFRQWRDNFTTYEAISPSALRLKSHVTNIISINLRPECIKSDEG